MPSKELKSLVNLKEESLAMASINKTTTNADEMKKTKKLLTKELSTSSTTSSSSTITATSSTTSTTSTTSQATTNTKLTKTKENIVKYKKSKSTSIENSSMEEKTEMLEEYQEKKEKKEKKVKKIEDEQQEMKSSKMENVSSEKSAIDKLPKNISKISSSSSSKLTSAASSSSTTFLSSTSSSTNQSNNCQVSIENIKEEMEIVIAADADGTADATNDKIIKTKMATGKKSLKVKATKKNELMKQQQEQQQQQQQSELVTSQQQQQQQQQQNGQRDHMICKKCNKPVYKMEEVKAEKQIFHKNCFRCNQCDKQLKVDNYQSHEGILYCIVHFKLLFAPKFVEDEKPIIPQKPELIIRENQPAELPPDVVRASEKPNLGLEELHQLNLRSRFQLFEKDNNNNNNVEIIKADGNITVKRSPTILAKMAKLTQQKQHDEQRTSHNDSDQDDEEGDVENDKNNSDDSSDDNNFMMNNEKLRQMQREQPLGLGEAMNDIRTRFENGPGLLKEERREERKQEIQHIRSRLFMGKQARIKEMYQQAVAQSHQSGHKQSNPKQLDIQVEIDAQRLKERFERGEINNNNDDNEINEINNDIPDKRNHHERKSSTLAQEAEVFEYGLSKASRSLFMEIDANVKAINQTATQLNSPKKFSNSTTNIINYYKTAGEQENMQRSSEVVKCNENTEDIVIKTAEISEKFKFFEKYQPVEEKRREFRITPPREGVVKMPSPEQEVNNNNEMNVIKIKESSPGLLRSNTTTIMLSKFRQMEKQNYKLSHRHNHNNNHTNYANDDDDHDDVDDDDYDSDDYMNEPKPLKCFTPPPEGEKQYYTNQESDYDNDSNDNDNDEDGNDENYAINKDDEALREARAAARAKKLRLKFEKWQSNEMAHESSHKGNIDVYSSQVSDDTTIESAKVLRERFENMKNTELQQQHSSRPRYKVKRFV